MHKQVITQTYKINNIDNLNFFYTNEYIDYEAVSVNAENKSCIFEYKNCKLLAPNIKNDYMLGGNKFSFIPLPYFAKDCPEKNKKILLGYYLDNLLHKNKKVFLRKDPLIIYDDSIEKIFLENGFDVSVLYTTIIDLIEDKSLLWSRVRKSYKSLINKVEKNFNIQIFNDYYKEKEFFEDWKGLYDTVTIRGNAVVSYELWNKMKSMYKNKKTFFVGIYDEYNLISCVELGVHDKNIYYLHSATHPKYEGTYSFTHALLWTVIKNAKELGYEKMEIGPVFFPGLSNHQASEKELAISNFKLGMGGKITPFLLFQRGVNEKN